VDFFFEISKADRISFCLERTCTFHFGFSLSKNTDRLLLIMRHPKIRTRIQYNNQEPRHGTIHELNGTPQWNVITECTEVRGWSACERVKPQHRLKLAFAMIGLFPLFTSCSSAFASSCQIERTSLRKPTKANGFEIEPKIFSEFLSTTPLTRMSTIVTSLAEPVIKHRDTNASAVPT
jgi:hypothetical protein